MDRKEGLVRIESANMLKNSGLRMPPCKTPHSIKILMLAAGSSELKTEDTWSDITLCRSLHEAGQSPWAMNASMIAAWGTLSKAFTASRKHMNRGVPCAMAACSEVMILNNADIQLWFARKPYWSWWRMDSLQFCKRFLSSDSKIRKPVSVKLIGR